MDYRELAESQIDHIRAATPEMADGPAIVYAVASITYALLHLAERVGAIDTGNMGSLRDGLDNIEDAINKASR